MPFPVSSAYIDEERKKVGSVPIYKLYWNRKDTTYFDNINTPTGTHTGTEVKGDGSLGLVAGNTTGNFLSDVFDTQQLTDKVVFQKLSWDVVGLTIGTLKMELRTAGLSVDVSSQVFREIDDDVITHVEDKRFYQFKISLTGTTEGPLLSNLLVRNLGIIPNNEIRSLADIQVGIPPTFDSRTISDLNFILDNRSSQWEPNKAGSYLRSSDSEIKVTFLNKIVEVWAGFKLLPAGVTEEINLMYRGILNRLQSKEGMGVQHEVTLNSTDFIFSTLEKETIGKTSSDGTPNPLMFGVRHREPMFETNATEFQWRIFGAPFISIDKIFKEVSDRGDLVEVLPAGFTVNLTTGFVTFTTDPKIDSKALFAKVTKNTTNNASDIALSVVQNTTVADEDINTASFTEAKDFIAVPPVVGASFSDTSATDALDQLLFLNNAALYVESGQLFLKNYDPIFGTVSNSLRTKVAGQTLENVISSSIDRNLDSLINRITIKFGDQKRVNTNIVVGEELVSTALFNKTVAKDFSFTFDDPVSVSNDTGLLFLIDLVFSRLTNRIDALDVNISLDVLKLRLLDIVDYTSDFQGLSAEKFFILNTIKSLSNFNGRLMLVKYPEQVIMQFSDDADVDDLFYFVDSPTPSDQTDFESNFL